ncbi:unnamed protein product [Paramecium pentaurelia]|uniref:Centrosomal protein POC5 n=1 Tax=Paramecium pentaurelia TaxID=43138 RepID=A0A8S1WS65_9CILI|nr:unnamed protein product [Paramecium pentaurelia]
MSFVNDLDDLCDFSKLSQKWKQNKNEQVKQPSPSPSKTESDITSSKCVSNPWNKENLMPNNEEAKKINNKIRNHAPQIIDEDTEQFKIRLEHILNVFKTEATSEFMTMKRSMLEDQKQTIKQDTEKYLQMYELKNNELQQIKEQLAEQMRICNQITERSEKMAQYCGKMKNTKRKLTVLSNVLKSLKMYAKYSQKKKNNQKKGIKHYKLYLQRWIFNLWKKQFNIQIRINQSDKLKLSHQNDVDLLMAKFKKEQQLLEQKLFEATTQLDEANKIKLSMQENLKRAFMRGVCALNFEAMNVLNGSSQQMELDSLATNILMNPYQQSSIQQQQIIHQPQQFNQLNDTLNLNESKDQWQRQNSPPKNIIYHQQNRLETNDHRWKDAPIIGIKQLSEITENQSINISISKLVQQDDLQFDKDDEQNEGKVIKVTFDNPSTLPSQTQSIKKQTVQTKQAQTKQPQKQTITTNSSTFKKK